MTETEYSRKLTKLDQLLNDPDVPMQPSEVWELLAEISAHDISGHDMSGHDISGHDMLLGPMVEQRAA